MFVFMRAAIVLVIGLVFYVPTVCSMTTQQDSFVKYDRARPLIFKIDAFEFQVDYVAVHAQLRRQVDSVRSVFIETGIQELWQEQKGSLGNIASSVIEFIFNDGTVIRHNVEAHNKSYFTTITRDAIQSKFKNFITTYNATDLLSAFDKTIGFGRLLGFYPDTEVQIISYLFFKDLYFQKLLLSLKSKSNPIKERLFADIDSCFDAKKEIKRDESTVGVLNNRIIPILKRSEFLAPSATELAEVLKGSQVSKYIQIGNILINSVQKRINSDQSVMASLSAVDLRNVVLHIHTELDPCPKCRLLLSALCYKMNAGQCKPNVFFAESNPLFAKSNLALPLAKFITLVSSSTSYPGNDLRTKLPVYAGGVMDSAKSCMFMPIDSLRVFELKMTPLSGDSLTALPLPMASPKPVSLSTVPSTKPVALSSEVAIHEWLSKNSGQRRGGNEERMIADFRSFLQSLATEELAKLKAKDASLFDREWRSSRKPGMFISEADLSAILEEERGKK